jgi:hypothetical protein
MDAATNTLVHLRHSVHGNRALVMILDLDVRLGARSREIRI